MGFALIAFELGWDPSLLSSLHFSLFKLELLSYACHTILLFLICETCLVSQVLEWNFTPGWIVPGILPIPGLDETFDIIFITDADWVMIFGAVGVKWI